MTQDTAVFWVLRVELILVLVWLALLVPISRRVIIAWTVYLSLRRSPNFRRPSARRWLWVKTLRAANGIDGRRDV